MFSCCEVFVFVVYLVFLDVLQFCFRVFVNGDIQGLEQFGQIVGDDSRDGICGVDFFFCDVVDMGLY